MSRPLRINYPEAIYHVMNRGIARNEIAKEKRDYEEFLKTFSEIHDLWRVQVYAYCIMNNHYHVCLKTPEGNLSRVMRHLDGLYTQRFNRVHRRDGPLFRGRYKAIVVDGDEHLTGVVRYIHLNPVRAGRVKSPQDYYWSSHKTYIRSYKTPLWLNTQEVLNRFSSNKGFHRFVISDDDDEVGEFYRKKRKGLIFGTEEFREKVMKLISKVSPEHPRYEKTYVRPSVERVLDVVAESYGVKVDDLLEGVRGRENEARKVGMYLVKRMCDLTLNEVAQRFGVTSYGVVGWACNGIRKKIELNKVLKKKVERIEYIIYQQKI
jgi:putative transposase